MKREATTNPKLRRLCRALGIGRAQAVGHLELLWHFTARQAPRGDVGRWEDDEIAEECAWDGDPAEFVGALVRAGWVDLDLDHRLIVHDWPDHADDAVVKRLKRGDMRERGVEWKDAAPGFVTPRPPEDEPTSDSGSRCPSGGQTAAAYQSQSQSQSQSQRVAGSTDPPEPNPPGGNGRASPAPEALRLSGLMGDLLRPIPGATLPQGWEDPLGEGA